MSEDEVELPELSELAPLIDQYDEIKQARLDHDRSSNALKKDEGELRKVIIAVLEASGLTSAGGSRVQVSIKKRTIVVADDWELIREYIIENDAWDILNRALNVSSIVERITAGDTIPGLTQHKVPTLSESRAALK